MKATSYYKFFLPPAVKGEVGSNRISSFSKRVYLSTSQTAFRGPCDLSRPVRGENEKNLIIFRFGMLSLVFAVASAPRKLRHLERLKFWCVQLLDFSKLSPAKFLFVYRDDLYTVFLMEKTTDAPWTGPQVVLV